MHAYRGLKSSLCAVALTALSISSAQAAAVPGQGTWETTLQARDINGDSVVDAYYDTALDITWLADWNVNGQKDWDTAKAWAAGLDVYGVTGWRLPSTVDDFSSLGGRPPVDSSEMAHMYYVTLENIGYPDAGYGLSNTANFVSMQSDYYWSGTGSASDPRYAWYFNPWGGGQGVDDKRTVKYAVAVHFGDVAAVPEPQTVALMLAGLAALAVLRRRQPR